MKKGNHVKWDKLYYVKRGRLGWEYQLCWAFRNDPRPLATGWERIDRLTARNMAGDEHHRQIRQHLPPRADRQIWPYGFADEERGTFEQRVDYELECFYFVRPISPRMLERLKNDAKGGEGA